MLFAYTNIIARNIIYTLGIYISIEKQFGVDDDVDDASMYNVSAVFVEFFFPRPYIKRHHTLCVHNTLCAKLFNIPKCVLCIYIQV